jgi:sRNA-binding regulator protein Hfq
MPIFDCPICHYKSFTEKESNEHLANKHKKEVQPTKLEVKKLEEKNKIKPAELEVKKPEEQRKPFIMPDFIKRFFHKTVSITLIDGSTISGELTGFNNYDLMIDDKIMILKHAMMKMQEIEANP